MDNKKVALWSIYNFGGAIVEIVFILYFSQWIVIDRGFSDIWFNATLIISSLLILLASPLASAWGASDRGGMSGLRTSTVASAVCFAGVGIVAAIWPAQAIFAAVLFTLGLFFYLFGGIFWSSLLADLASRSRFGIANGWGQFGDWTGEIFGLLITLPLIGGTFVLFGTAGRAQTFLPAAVLFLVFAAPMLLFYRVTKRPRGAGFHVAREYRSAIGNLIELCRTRGLGWFFLAFFFFNDAIITAANNFPIYLQRVFGIPDELKSFLLVAILASSALGALIGGKIVDRIGAKRALMWNLAGWIVILPAMGATSNFRLFTAETIVMGLWFGSVWVIARSLVAHLAPERSLNRAFSYYTLMERFATLIGPLSWSLIVAFLPRESGFSYRVAIACMAVFVAIGFLAARNIPASKPTLPLVS